MSTTVSPDLITWLLDSPTPSLRYLTLRDLLDRPADDPELRAAQTAIMDTGPVPLILEGQTEAGHWRGERSYYTPKYTATHWSLVLLTEFAADPANAQLQRGVEFMLADTIERCNGYHAPEQQDWACFWGNIVRYACYAGRADDPRLANIIEVLVLAAGARKWGCRQNNELPCAWGAVRALWGLAALPDALRTPEVNAAIASGIVLLAESAETLVTGAYPTPADAPHKCWAELNFPLFYPADILFVLRTLAELDALDQPGAQAGLDWLVAQRQDNGRWRGVSPNRAMTWKPLGDRADPSRWVSLHAARVLRSAGRVV